MTDWLLVALAVGAIARLTRLVNADTITEPARQWVRARARHARNARREARAQDQAERDAEQGRRHSLRAWYRRHYANRWIWLDKLLACPWCVSVWVSVPVAVAAIRWGDGWVVQAGLLALTGSWVAGNTQAREPIPPDVRATEAIVDASMHWRATLNDQTRLSDRAATDNLRDRIDEYLSGHSDDA